MARNTEMAVCGCVAVLLVACSGVAEDRSFGIEQNSSSWSTNLADGSRTPGIANGSITKVKMMSGTPPGVTLAFWLDAGGGSGSGVGRSGIATYDATFKRKSGEDLKVHAETKDGSTATVRIGEKEFTDVGNAIFLIATEGEKVRIKKMKFDREKFPKDLKLETIVEYAQATDAIREFWSPEQSATAAD